VISGIPGDFRIACRALRATPVVTLAAVLTLALGIGAITAIFSVADALMLRPLPVRDPQRLVTVTSQTALHFGFQAGAGWSYSMWQELRDRAHAFDGAFAWTIERVDLADGGEMQPATALLASGGLFSTLGVPAMVGRTFTVSDDVRGGGPDGAVAVISYDLWQRRFNRAPGVIGARLPIDRVPFTIIGIMPPRFSGVDVGQAFDVALPFGAEPLLRGARSLLDDQRALLLTVMLRLKPAQSIAMATETLRAMQPQIVGALTHPPPFLQDPFIVVPASTGISDRTRLRQKYASPLLAIAIASGLVLLLMCLNVANMMLARAAARRHEISVRLALGATRLQVARLVLLEGVVLGGIAAVLGVMFATWASHGLVAQLPASAGSVLLDVSLDWRVIAFTAGVTAATILLFSILPALRAAGVSSGEALRDEARGSIGGRRQPLSGGLIVAQVAISLVLVVAAGLFVRTLNGLVSVPLGFNPDGVLIVTVDAGHVSVEGPARLALYERVVQEIAAVPGVARAAGSMWTPMGGRGGGLLSDARGRNADSTRVAFNFVTPGWFDTYATPKREGRDLSERDVSSAPRVAIVNEAFSRRFFPGRSSVGETIKAGPCGDAGCTVVGIVADAAYSPSLRDGAPPTIYMPLAQSAGLGPLRSTSVEISVRAAGEPMRLRQTIATRLRDIEPALTFTFRPLGADVRASFAQERLVATLAGFFGLIALILSALGVYGIVAYAVSRRRAEIGIRLALGAQPAAVTQLMMRRVLILASAGMTLGLAASLWLSRFVTPLVYGLESWDPITLVSAVVLVALVGTIAAWVPAARAARLDPARVLREN
jgi:putative ABC transport system permease protein